MKSLALRAHGKGLELACRIAPDVPDLADRRPRPPAPGAGQSGRQCHQVHRARRSGRRRTPRIRDRRQRSSLALSPCAIRASAFQRRSEAGSSSPSSRPTARPRAASAARASGLAISARLVEMMGGRIWVESEVGPGQHVLTSRSISAVPQEQPRRNRTARPGISASTCPSWSSTTTRTNRRTASGDARQLGHEAGCSRRRGAGARSPAPAAPNRGRSDC